MSCAVLSEGSAGGAGSMVWNLVASSPFASLLSPPCFFAAQRMRSSASWHVCAT